MIGRHIQETGMDTVTLLDGVTVTGVGAGVFCGRIGPLSFQAVVEGDGAVTATVVVQGSLDGENWVDIVSIGLDDTDVDTDGTVQNPWMWSYVRGNVTALTGTDAAVTLLMGA